MKKSPPESSAIPSTSGSMLSLATSKKKEKKKENVFITHEKHDAKLKKLDNQKKKANLIKKTAAGKIKTPPNERTPSAQLAPKRVKLDESEEDAD